MSQHVAPFADTLSVLNAVPARYLVLLADAPRFTVVAATDAYLQVTGRCREKLVGQSLFAVLSNTKEATGLKNIKASLERVLQHGQEHCMEEQPFDVLDPVHGVSTCTTGRLRNTPVLDSNGVVQYIIHSLEGVAQRRQAPQEVAGREEGLRASEQLIKATLDASQDMIQVFRAVRDKEGKIMDFEWIMNNHASEAYYGNVIGKRLLAHNPGVKEEGIFDAFVQVTETGVPQQNERHYVHEQYNGWFYQSVVKLGDGVVTITANITERKRAEAEVLRLKDDVAQRATDKYYSIFNAIDEGFCIYELVYDDKGEPVDLRWVEVNPAYEKQTGLKDVIGKSHSDLSLATEKYWFDIYDKVAKTGEAVYFESWHEPTRRWYHVFASRIGGVQSRQVAVVFEDITQRKGAEQRQVYLLKLSDALRSISDAVEIEETVTAMAMEHFGADRCYYCTIEGDSSIIRRDARKEGFPSVAGSYPLSSFALFKKVVDGGVAFVVNDARSTDLLDEPLRDLYLQLQVVSFVDTPVVKKGKAVGILCLVQSTPRTWTEMEIQLAVETAERTWAAVERARAEEALRRAEEAYRLQLEEEVQRRTRELKEEHYFLEQVTDKSPHLIYVFDLDEQRFTYINKRVEQLVGRDQEYVYAMGPHLFQAIIHPADLAEREAYMSALATLNEQEIRDHEFRIWTGSSFRWFCSKDSIFKKEDGVVKQVIGLAEDVTYEKMMQEKIQREGGQRGLN